jgi:hypothetical protein
MFRQASRISPPPLPGQPGYKMRESDRLAAETRDMQINLLKLREQMAQVKTRGGADGGSGGSVGGGSVNGGGGGRWRSARADRGGLRGYSDSVRKGAHKRRDRAAARETVSSFVQKFGQGGQRRVVLMSGITLENLCRVPPSTFVVRCLCCLYFSAREMENADAFPSPFPPTNIP